MKTKKTQLLILFMLLIPLKTASLDKFSNIQTIFVNFSYSLRNNIIFILQSYTRKIQFRITKNKEELSSIFYTFLIPTNFWYNPIHLNSFLQVNCLANSGSPISYNSLFKQPNARGSSHHQMNFIHGRNGLFT